jgi:3-hydroxybutyryl-CoA dehydrogenase
MQDVKNLCVVGAGTMGTGIAQVAAQAGLQVCLLETAEAARERSRRRLDKALQGAVERGKLSPEEAALAGDRVSWHADFEPLREAEWVIEAVFEEVTVKREVWEAIGRLAPEQTPLATNTSTLPISSLAHYSGRPRYFLGMHFFNPPAAMKLVEVIAGPETLPLVLEAALALCERLGKTPLQAPDIPGFIVNRAFAAVVAAAAEVWAGGGDPQTIDTALELGLGHKMGPLRTADLVGLDIVKAIADSLTELTGHDRFALPPRFEALIAEGKLGVKTGEGFYRYDS